MLLKSNGVYCTENPKMAPVLVMTSGDALGGISVTVLPNGPPVTSNRIPKATGPKAGCGTAGGISVQPAVLSVLRQPYWVTLSAVVVEVAIWIEPAFESPSVIPSA